MASIRGHSFANEAAFYVEEYAQRKRLAKLGYVSSPSELPAFKAEIFAIIDTEIDKIQALDMRSKNGRK